MCSLQIIEPSPLHDMVQSFGPSPPLGNAIHLRKRLIGPSPPFGGDAEGRGGVFPRPLGRFYAFLNTKGIA